MTEIEEGGEVCNLTKKGFQGGFRAISEKKGALTSSSNGDTTVIETWRRKQ